MRGGNDKRQKMIEIERSVKGLKMPWSVVESCPYFYHLGWFKFDFN